MPKSFMDEARSASLGFAFSRLDRQANERAKPDFLSTCLIDPAARFVLIAGDMILLAGGPNWSALFDRDDMIAAGGQEGSFRHQSPA
jgi:hypothetical protein